MSQFYRIRGANSQTGHEISTSIKASTRQEAEGIAAQRGILISEIDPKEDGLPLRPGQATEVAPDPQFRFLKREAFAFGFFAGWGLLFVYVFIRFAEFLIGVAAQIAKGARS